MFRISLGLSLTGIQGNLPYVPPPPPDPPSVPVITEVKTSGHSVYLTFNEPASPYPITYYESTLDYEGTQYIYRMTYLTDVGGVVRALALSPAGTYQYRVRASNKTGVSDWSLPIDGTADLYPPQLTIDSYASTPTGVNLDFDLPIDISSGDVFYVQGYNSTGDTIDDEFPIERQDPIKVRGIIALPNKGSWTLAIRSTNQYGNGAWSNQFQVLYSAKHSEKRLTPVRIFNDKKIIVVDDGVDVGRLSTQSNDFIIT